MQMLHTNTTIKLLMFGAGTSVHGWTQPKLASFLEFLDSQSITRVGIWCMTGGHDPIGFPCPGVREHCPWQYEELKQWKARRIPVLPQL